MSEKQLDSRKLLGWMLVVAGFFYALIILQPLVAPIVVAIFFSFLLYPIADKFCKKLRTPLPLAIGVSLTVIIFPLIILVYFFWSQMSIVAEDFSLMTERIEISMSGIFDSFSEFLPFLEAKSDIRIEDRIDDAIGQPLPYIAQGLTASVNFMANALLVVIYIFFFIYYGEAFKRFFYQQFPEDTHRRLNAIIKGIQVVAKRYFFGVGTVVLIIGFVNSIGLLLLGVPFAFFWGFLAGLLTIIPYIGTVIGGLLPVLYIFSISDDIYKPIMVMVLFGVVQTIEGNFITPRVVGGSVKINSLFAIIGLLIGGMIWGMIGLILALPLLASMRVIFYHIDVLKPYSLLLSSNFKKKSSVFETELNDDKYRFWRYFYEDKK
jgi:predicted PurR-regulated permease PerM